MNPYHTEKAALPAKAKEMEINQLGYSPIFKLLLQLIDEHNEYVSIVSDYITITSLYIALAKLEIKSKGKSYSITHYFNYDIQKSDWTIPILTCDYPNQPYELLIQIPSLPYIRHQYDYFEVYHRCSCYGIDSGYRNSLSQIDLYQCRRAAGAIYDLSSSIRTAIKCL